jgi:choline dehydrogenase-like flavoprotein
MLRDAHDIQEGSLIQADVCIVGGGPAGITLARQLAARSLDVCLLESGGLTFEAATQGLCAGEAAGTLLPPESGYENWSRLRLLGGASGHWGGVFRPLDALDFEARPWVPHSGWPFGAAELAPYYAAACAICGVPGFEDDAGSASRRFEKPVVPLGDNPRVVTHVFHQNQMHFGVRYRDELVRSRKIHVILHATAMEVATDATGSAVERVSVASLGGRRFGVRAKAYVLATGGIENARLLLLSNRVQPQGVGNEHDQVGRYFMEHPHIPIGRVVIWRPARELGLYMDLDDDRFARTRVTAAFRIADDAQREHRLLNGNFTLVSLTEPFTATLSGYQAFLRAEVEEMHQGKDPPSESAAGFDTWYRTYSSQTPLFESVYHTARDLDSPRSSRPDAGEASTFRGLLFARVEQAPNPDSRVTLGEKRDALGQPRVRLNWNLTDLDKTSLVDSVKIFGGELGRSGLGRAQALLDSSTVFPMAGGGCHHMGTTRMHPDPQHGVVDAQCRVHGVSNLFVAGSSVFPTTGHANPSLTLIALSVRLAGHIAASL